MTRQNLVDFNFADPFYQYPERRHLRSHGNHNNKNKKVNYNIAKIISNLKYIYNQMGLKKFVDAIKGTTKKLLLMILQKVLENKNKFESFVDILSVCAGRSRQQSKESKSYSNRNKIRVKLNYSSKILDIINISSLISARDVKSKIPEEYCDYDIEIINIIIPQVVVFVIIIEYWKIYQKMTLMIIVHAYVKEIALIIKSENSYIVQWVMWLQVIQIQLINWVTLISLKELYSWDTNIEYKVLMSLGEGLREILW